MLAPGGKVAYLGTPSQLRPFFGSRLGNDDSYSRIFGLIAAEPAQAKIDDRSLVAFPFLLPLLIGAHTFTGTGLALRRLIRT